MFFSKSLVVIFLTISLNCVFSFKLECYYYYHLARKNTYKCEALELTITEPNQIVSEVVGNQEPGRETEDVVMLLFERQKTEYLPQGLNKFFPNVNNLVVMESELKHLTKHDLKNFPKLKNIFIARNNIESLPNDLFEYTPEIKSKFLKDNNIKHIGRDIFKPLKQLESVNLEGNICINENASGHNEIETMMEKATACYQ
ncbi:hypothetical protein PVAND_000282 [Polypedilum vanderplanki]|uniref:Uncharacterized protein n=1 Tax=Polypedilum vanderplanki TaxID=319348 RepID=A0A9J6BJU9_POLVA|nr:hypothetical protein PVAND_000282 [Polypedilum vanderplanki]